MQEPVEGQSPLLWVTLPPFNPVNSPLVSRLAGIAAGAMQFSLLQEYRWPALSDGVCPNGTDGSAPETREGDSDLQVSIEAEPQGAVFGGQANGLFWVTDPSDVSLPAGEDLALSLLQPRNPPVADGQLLDYTVHYLNRGADVAVGVYVQLKGYGHIRGVPETLELGDVPPGGAGEATFQAVVDRSQGVLPIAGVLARVYDASHGPDGPPLDWLSVTHRVDRGAPEAPELVLPSRVGPLREFFAGRVLDESGIRAVTLDVQWPGGSRQITCPLVRPADGDWACAWDAGTPAAPRDAADGARAGHRSSRPDEPVERTADHYRRRRAAHRDTGCAGQPRRGRRPGRPRHADALRHGDRCGGGHRGDRLPAGRAR